MKGKKFIAIISIVCILAVLLCIPAFATVTESDGDGYALYNGVMLPNIDSVWTDKETYPYCVIFTDGSSKKLTLFNSESRVSISDILVATNSPLIYAVYQVTSTSEQWDYVSSGSTTKLAIYGIPKAVFWSNHDIINESDNSIYLASSEPISLDGMNVIEWDGDITGFSSSDTWYSLSNYEDASNGIAVYVDGSNLSVGTNFVVSDSGWTISHSVDNSSSLPIARGLPTSGISAVCIDDSHYTSLIAYRAIESPPGEGGDTPDEPQPPFGRLKYTLNYIY